MCEDCPDEENKLVRLRFIGGRDKPYGLRGAYLSFETGKIYEVGEEALLDRCWERVDDEVEPKTEAEPEISVEPEKEAEIEPLDEEPLVENQSPGLTREFNRMPPTPEDFIRNMGIKELKILIQSQGGKVDGRWGLERLREEALKLQ